MPLVKWMEYEEMMKGISEGNWRIIGWGAGIGFSNFHLAAPIRHDYLVDSDPTKWGTIKHGFEVRSPEAIASEDPSRTIVIIYNFFDHGRAILSALEKIGPYKAMMNFHPSVLQTFIKRLKYGINNSLIKKKPANSGMSILVQGPLVEGITEWVVKYYANCYPNDWLVVSTWDDSPPELIDRISPFCDRMLCNKTLPSPGIGNRNNQIISTRSGLEEISELGISKVLKTRTDTLVTADYVLERSNSLQNTFNIDACVNYGLSNRIIGIERYTMRYIPYRISDILLFGDVEDMLKYWATPLDERNTAFSSWTEMSFKETSQIRQSTEVYITSHFLEQIGYPLNYTLEDYWNVLRNLFIIVDERFFGHYFPRYDVMTLDDGRDRFSGNSYVDFNFWLRLYAGLDLKKDIEEIKIDRIKMKDSFSNNPVPVNSLIYHK